MYIAVHRLGLIQVFSTVARIANKKWNKECNVLGLVRDDLSTSGQKEIKQRARVGRLMMKKTATENNNGNHKKCGFGKIETLPGLRNEAEAREPLQTLASDPDVLACMVKHQLNVGSKIQPHRHW